MLFIFYIILLVALAIDVLGGLLIQILADAIQFVRRAERVEGQLLHVGLDQAILWIDGENVVNQTLVARPQRRAAAATT